MGALAGAVTAPISPLQAVGVMMVVTKTIVKPSSNHRQTIVKPSSNHRQTIVKPDQNNSAGMGNRGMVSQGDNLGVFFPLSGNTIPTREGGAYINRVRNPLFRLSAEIS